MCVNVSDHVVLLMVMDIKTNSNKLSFSIGLNRKDASFYLFDQCHFDIYSK